MWDYIVSSEFFTWLCGGHLVRGAGCICYLEATSDRSLSVTSCCCIVLWCVEQGGIYHDSACSVQAAECPLCLPPLLVSPLQYHLMLDTGSSNTGIIGYSDPDVGAAYDRYTHAVVCVCLSLCVCVCLSVCVHAITAVSTPYIC